MCITMEEGVTCALIAKLQRKASRTNSFINSCFACTKNVCTTTNVKYEYDHFSIYLNYLTGSQDTEGCRDWGLKNAYSLLFLCSVCHKNRGWMWMKTVAVVTTLFYILHTDNFRCISPTYGIHLILSQHHHHNTSVYLMNSNFLAVL